MFGGFQWARAVSPFKLLAENDPIHTWRENLLDAFDGTEIAWIRRVALTARLVHCQDSDLVRKYI